MLSRLTWMVATHRATVAGQTVPESVQPDASTMDMSILPIGGELPLDGRPYCLSNGWCFSLLDQAARIGLEHASSTTLESMLQALGIPQQDIQQMLMELGRYLQRGYLNGARRTLRSPMEVFVLPAWRSHEDQLVAAGWNELFVVDEPALNINTASPEILGFAWQLPTDNVNLLVAARAQAPIVISSELSEIMGIYAQSISFESMTRLASSTLLIRLYPPDRGARHEYRINFSPDDLQRAPWQWLQRRSVTSHALDAAFTSSLHKVPGILAAPFVATQ